MSAATRRRWATVSHSCRELTGETEQPLTGTVEQVAERLREYEAVGVERAMLQHLVHEDVDMVGLLGELAAALR